MGRSAVWSVAITDDDDLFTRGDVHPGDPGNAQSCNDAAARRRRAETEGVLQALGVQRALWHALRTDGISATSGNSGNLRYVRRCGRFGTCFHLHRGR